jgi:hypothetical protein
MLNAQIAAAFVSGQRLIQSFTGENISFKGANPIPCLPADLITGNRLWEQGGASEQINITVSILKADLPDAPLTNTHASFRGYDLRVISVNDADTFWTVQLIQPRA